MPSVWFCFSPTDVMLWFTKHHICTDSAHPSFCCETSLIYGSAHEQELTAGQNEWFIVLSYQPTPQYLSKLLTLQLLLGSNSEKYDSHFTDQTTSRPNWLVAAACHSLYLGKMTWNLKKKISGADRQTPCQLTVGLQALPSAIWITMETASTLPALSSASESAYRSQHVMESYEFYIHLKQIQITDTAVTAVVSGAATETTTQT